MSGRFAGSQSLDERRRRRLATDEPGANTPNGPDGSDSRPLPARPPSAQFPLRRIISRAQWKLVLSLFGIACVAAMILVLGHFPRVADGAYGPGLAGLAADHAGRLVTVFMGGLLLAAAQFSWLIRWARSRSLRDFRGRYRIWWWSAAALSISGMSILIDAPAALSATIAWATNWPPVLGGFAAYELAPALLAILVFLPGLQRDMRGCRTSRLFLFLSGFALVAAGGATVAADSFAGLLSDAGAQVSPRLVVQGLWLLGAVGLLGAFLFHARHVIYESVEPPESGKQKRQEKSAVKPEESAAATKARSAAKGNSHGVETKQPTSRTPAKPRPAAKPAAAQEPTPPKAVAESQPAKRPVAAAVPQETRDDRWAEIGTIEVDGRVIRLDGSEDPMKGLSKRERRKVRKAIKDRQRTGDEEY